jgi:hypothetical protein
MAEEPTRYEEIRARITGRYERRKTFLTEGGGLLTATIVLLVLWFSTEPSARMSSLLFFLVCGGMFLGFLEQLVNFVMGELADRAVERAIEREREHQLALVEKAKHDDLHYLHLSDDGELVDMAEADAHKAKREEF